MIPLSFFLKKKKEYNNLLMFTGYSFFDYKYDIPDYNGYDYDHFGRYLFLIIASVTILVAVILLRKMKREHIVTYLKVMAITMTALYITKTTWETIHDIQHDGAFNMYLLPFDTCSMLMFASFFAGFGKGKVQSLGASWLATGGIVGGLSNLLFLQALHYYPFFTFGAFYSMLWHWVMVFTGVLLLVTNFVPSHFSTLLYAFLFHMGFSLIVIPFDYIRDMDFMMYRYAGGIPLIEDLVKPWAENHLNFLVTMVMIVVYFALFAAFVYLSLGIKTLVHLLFPKKENPAQEQA